MKFEPCDRCGKMVDTESPSIPSHDCETDEDRFDELMRRIDELESRVSEIEDGAADKRIGEEGVLLCGRMYGHPLVCTLPSDHPGDCRQRTAKVEPDAATVTFVLASLDAELARLQQKHGEPEFADGDGHNVALEKVRYFITKALSEARARNAEPERGQEGYGMTAEGKLAQQRLVQTVACPTCKARVGQHCVPMPGAGIQSVEYHFERMDLACPRSEPGRGPRREVGPLPPTALWVDHEHRCDSVSPDGDHACTIGRSHAGAHVEIDPVFGSPHAAWPACDPRPEAFPPAAPCPAGCGGGLFFKCVRCGVDMSSLDARNRPETARPKDLLDRADAWKTERHPRTERIWTGEIADLLAEIRAETIEACAQALETRAAEKRQNAKPPMWREARSEIHAKACALEAAAKDLRGMPEKGADET